MICISIQKERHGGLEKCDLLACACKSRAPANLEMTKDVLWMVRAHQSFTSPLHCLSQSMRANKTIAKCSKECYVVELSLRFVFLDSRKNAVLRRGWTNA